jgi:hypothetical protein
VSISGLYFIVAMPVSAFIASDPDGAEDSRRGEALAATCWGDGLRDFLLASGATLALAPGEAEPQPCPLLGELSDR